MTTKDEALALAMYTLEELRNNSVLKYEHTFVDTAITAIKQAQTQGPAKELAQESAPLTDDKLRKLHHEDEFGLFCDYAEFEQISRAIEAAHGIKTNGGYQ
jgi:hypothetical protein